MLSLNLSPFPVLETERLLLRELSMADLEDLYALRTNEKIYAYLRKDMDASLEVTKAKIEEILEKQEKDEAVFWVITLKADPLKMIGNIGYWRMQKEHYRAEIGYILHPDQWKKGIMKEALNAAIEYAFTKTNMHSIEGHTGTDNIASRSLLESCGFVKEAYLKENYYHDGVFYDSFTYSRLR